MEVSSLKRTLSIALLLSIFLLAMPLPVIAETSQGFEWSYSGINRYFFHTEQWSPSDSFGFDFYADVNTTGVDIPDPLSSWEQIPTVPTTYNLTDPEEGELDFVESLMTIYGWATILPLGNWTHLTIITESRTTMPFGREVVPVHPIVDRDDELYWGFNYSIDISGQEIQAHYRYFKEDGVLASMFLIGHDSEGSITGYIDLRRDGSPPVTTYPADMVIESGELGDTLTWSVYDNSSGYYTVYMDDAIYMNGTWDGGDINVTVSLDGLDLGVHRFNATFYDAGGNSTFDIVLVEVVDTTVPVIDSPEDVTYEEGTTGHSIEWSPTDHNPLRYEIYLDGVLIEDEAWPGGSISIDIDGLTMGTYTYTIIVFDIEGASVTDDVTVEVTISTVTLAFGTGGAIVIIAVAAALRRR